MGSVLLIVAKFQEDISWIRDVPATWTVKVYEKGPGGPYRNCGREAETYARALRDHYGLFCHEACPWSHVIFVQGRPSDHCRMTDITHPTLFPQKVTIFGD